MFKWYKKFINSYYGEICDICGKRAIRSKAGALIHYSSSGIYVHPEHLLKNIKAFYDSPWAKKVAKAIKEDGVYVMSHQEEAIGAIC